MLAVRPVPFLQRHMAWLVWLAMLLPMAQMAAMWHGVSHANTRVAGADDPLDAPQTTPCDLCLAGATVTGGAALVAWPAVSPAVAAHELPALAFASVCVTALALAYRSRAPLLVSA